MEPKPRLGIQEIGQRVASIFNPESYPQALKGAAYYVQDRLHSAKDLLIFAGAVFTTVPICTAEYLALRTAGLSETVTLSVALATGAVIGAASLTFYFMHRIKKHGDFNFRK